jgi:Ca2+-binding RTX toxin-like protein
VIEAGPGNDVTWAGQGADLTLGGAGDDQLHALADDNNRDRIDCGPGDDTVFLNSRERRRDSYVNCERVVVVTPEPGSADSQDG